VTGFANSRLDPGLLLWVCLAALAICPPQARSQAGNEYQVKAIFLYNFTKFVEWPADPANEPIVIGIIGEDPFGNWLDEAIRGKTANGHKLVVRHLKGGEEARACQVVFFSASEVKRLHTTLDSLTGASVLTVGEKEGFAEEGGIINFTLEDSRVHFEINVDAAQRAGLKISSKLLSLAKVVRDSGQGGSR